MRAWWKRQTKKTKGRIAVYGSLVALVGGSLWWMGAMPGKSFHGAVVVDDTERVVSAKLKYDVQRLAGDPPGGAGERNTSNTKTLSGLDRAWSTIELTFFDIGLDPKRRTYKFEEHQVTNIDAVVKGKYRADEVVLVGAHYDSAPGTVGADDNASGVAIMFALARAFVNRPQARSIRFVAFTNEEPPHFWTPSMGSLVYAKDCKSKNENIVSMMSLESLGYYRDDAGTQSYPPVVSWFYPSRGDFVAFVGNFGGRSLVRSAIGAFRKSANMPSEGGALPSFISGVGWSDHWAFWEVGYPAFMVTDTATFRNPNYHKPTDRPDTLDYDRMARVVSGLTAVIEKLAE